MGVSVFPVFPVAVFDARILTLVLGMRARWLLARQRISANNSICTIPVSRLYRLRATL